MNEKEWYRYAFNNFMATLASWSTPKCICMDWHNQNGSREGAIRFLLDVDSGNLIISGDYGMAIAHWDTKLTPEKVYRFTNDTGYFADKIRCTTDRYIYSNDAAKEDLELIAKKSRANKETTEFLLQFLNTWFSENEVLDAACYPLEVKDALNRLNPNWNIFDQVIGRRMHGRIGIWAWAYQKAYERLADNPDFARLEEKLKEDAAV